MRFLQIVGSARGGMSAHVRQLCDLLAEAGHTVVLAGPAIPAGPRWRSVDVAVPARPSLTLARSVCTLKRLARGADVVHAHGIRASFLAALALPRGARLLSTWHSVPGGDQPSRLAALMCAVVARRADCVLAVSTDLAHLARTHHARRVIHALVPPPALSDGTIAAARALAPTRASAEILTIARLAPQKGIDLALEASRLLVTRGLAHTWTLCGDGPLLADAETTLAATGAPVNLAGHCTDVATRLARCTLFVQTSRSEGQPVAVQEALAAGCAIVATAVGGTTDVLAGAGLTVPPDATALADAIEALLTNPVRLAELREAAVARARALPSPADMRDQVLAEATSLAPAERTPRHDS